jgi:hypothetical protein
MTENNHESKRVSEITGLEHLVIGGIFAVIGLTAGFLTDYSLVSAGKGILGGLGLYGFCLGCGVYADIQEENRVLYPEEDGDGSMEI